MSFLINYSAYTGYTGLACGGTRAARRQGMFCDRPLDRQSLHRAAAAPQCCTSLTSPPVARPDAPLRLHRRGCAGAGGATCQGQGGQHGAPNACARAQPVSRVVGRPRPCQRWRTRRATERLSLPWGLAFAAEGSFGAGGVPGQAHPPDHGRTASTSGFPCGSPDHPDHLSSRRAWSSSAPGQGRGS